MKKRTIGIMDTKRETPIRVLRVSDAQYKKLLKAKVIYDGGGTDKEFDGYNEVRVSENKILRVLAGVK